MQAGKTPSVVDLAAILNVEKATALRDELSAALNASDIVSVSFASVEELDLSCIQVLYAALASAKASGKALHFVGALSSRVATRLKSCGFMAIPQGKAADLEAALGLIS